MSNQQIVPYAPTDQQVEPAGALVVSAGHQQLGIQQSHALERLRQDREEHRHKQIWTKDAHGGPYRKVSSF